jgi:alpha-beta hydrolase superfamily lysophospholipase
MNILKILFFLIILSSCASLSLEKENKLPLSVKEVNSAKPFSVKEINAAKPVPIPQIKYIESNDKIKLAYREYVPKQIEAVLVFYHGAIGHSGAMYPHIGNDLKNNYNILTITPDIRGHGYSGGRRGDTPTPQHVHEDVSVFIRHLKNKYPNKLIFLGGHSAGAGSLLNYSSYNKKEKVAGYIFIAPYLGWRSQTKKENMVTPLVKYIKEDLFIKNAMFGGHGNEKAIFYNVSDETLKKRPKAVPAITVNMSNAIDPTSPALQLQNFPSPLTVWIGSKDEAFNAHKLVSFIKRNNPKAETKIIEGEKHLSIILISSKYIGEWINRFIKG